jgi:hypothetical protein
MPKRVLAVANDKCNKKSRRPQPKRESIDSFYKVIHDAYVYMNGVVSYSMSTTPSDEYVCSIQSTWDARSDVLVTCMENDEFDMAYTKALNQYVDQVFISVTTQVNYVFACFDL